MGRRFVEWCLLEGFEVAVVDLPGDRLDALGQLTGVTVYPLDVTDLAAVEATARQIVDDLGGIDRLVSAAGIARGALVGELATTEAARVVQVNLLGTIHWIDQVIAAMKARGSGEIICVASLAGFLPTNRMAAYVASKFGVVGYLESLAKEVRGSGVLLKCVCPPGVDTPMLDDIIRGGGMPTRAVRLVKPIAPQEVVDAVSASMRSDRLLVFPGRGSLALWRIRRWAPRLTDRMMALLYSA
jgi:NAD(P)-dependent dehydrogenase (short-subunit alcohol dehydrogenase family)